MNVRKPVDYGTMYRELAAILAQNLPQMGEIHAIGKAVRQRPEKGAAVAAAEFLQANFPDRTGFSPRNVRRMRDFWQLYSGWRKIESSLFCILKNALLRLRSWKGGFTTGAENGLIFFISFMKDCMPTTRIRRLRAVKKSRTGIKIICLFC